MAEWRERAACLGKSLETFYPNRQHGNLASLEALSICERCPVRKPCLAEAMTDELGHGLACRHGIRGGLTAQQRYVQAR